MENLESRCLRYLLSSARLVFGMYVCPKNQFSLNAGIQLPSSKRPFGWMLQLCSHGSGHQITSRRIGVNNFCLKLEVQVPKPQQMPPRRQAPLRLVQLPLPSSPLQLLQR